MLSSCGPWRASNLGWASGRNSDKKEARSFRYLCVLFQPERLGLNPEALGINQRLGAGERQGQTGMKGQWPKYRIKLQECQLLGLSGSQTQHLIQLEEQRQEGKEGVPGKKQRWEQPVQFGE